MTDDRLYKAEDGSALRFWWGTEKNNFLSEQENRPVHDEALYLEIFSPGSRESSPVHTVIKRYNEAANQSQYENPEMFERYGAQIKAFLSNDDSAAQTGTPLDEASFLDRAMVASLKESKVFTIEGLAALPDEKLRILGLGGRTLVDKAKAYLEAAQGGEAVARLTTEIADLRNTVDVATKRAEAAEARIAELEKEKGSTDTKPTKPTNVAKDPKTVDGSDII